MYIASLLNAEGRFRRLGAWLKNGRTPPERVEAFLARATAAVLSVRRMEGLEATCLGEFRRHRHNLTIKGERIAFWSPTLLTLINEASPFFGTIRIMQNMLLPLVAKEMELRISIPSSMADAVKKLSSYGFTEELSKRVLAYWQNSGRGVKDYRDLDQHYEAVARASFLQIAPEERLCIFLPDDPTKRRSQDFTFDQRKELVPYCGRALDDLCTLVDSAAQSLGLAPIPIDQSFDLSASENLMSGERRTLALLIEDSVRLEGFEIGQTEERKAAARRLPPPA